MVSNFPLCCSLPVKLPMHLLMVPTTLKNKFSRARFWGWGWEIQQGKGGRKSTCHFTHKPKIKGGGFFVQPMNIFQMDMLSTVTIHRLNCQNCQRKKDSKISLSVYPWPILVQLFFIYIYVCIKQLIYKIFKMEYSWIGYFINIFEISAVPLESSFLVAALQKGVLNCHSSTLPPRKLFNNLLWQLHL